MLFKCIKILVDRHFHHFEQQHNNFHTFESKLRQLFVEETMLIRQRQGTSLRSLLPPRNVSFQTERHFRLGISSLRSRFKEGREPPSLVTLTQSDSSSCVSVYPGSKSSKSVQEEAIVSNATGNKRRLASATRNLWASFIKWYIRICGNAILSLSSSFLPRSIGAE